MCSAWNLLNALTEKPYVTLKIGAKNVNFLCDTGACKTILKTDVPGLKPSRNSIWVKSADGETNKQSISKPTTVEDPKTGVIIITSLVISPKCPINLLGRDLMTKLGIAVVPVSDNGMRAARVKPGEIYVSMQDESLFCSYDLEPVKNGQSITRLLNQTKEQLSCPEDEMPYSGLHATMNVLTDPSDDYVPEFLAETPVLLAITYLYTDRRSFAAAAVLLPSEKENVYKLNAVPHISLYKPRDIEWADIGPREKMASLATDYRDDIEGWMYSPSCNMWKQRFCDMATADAKLHLMS